MEVIRNPLMSFCQSMTRDEQERRVILKEIEKKFQFSSIYRLHFNYLGYVRFSSELIEDWILPWPGNILNPSKLHERSGAISGNYI